ncbi:MAG TPA: hypothetical protein VHL14_06945, partial [Steroidobacteraceae bacterium]|nr:hypothetical protein [Steroidobacteraceae bacterium]
MNSHSVKSIRQLHIVLTMGASALLASLACHADSAAAPTRTALLDELRAGNWPRNNQQLLIKPEVEAFVTELMSKMTLEEKVAQMVQADRSAIRPEELRTFAIGSVEAGGDSAPNDDIHASPA